MKSSEFAYMSVSELSKKLHDKELSPVEVVEASIERIEERNKSLNAFVFTDFENARKLAKQSETRLLNGTAGAMEGIPTATKDLFDYYPSWPNTLPERKTVERIQYLHRTYGKGGGHTCWQDQQSYHGLQRHLR